MLKQKYTEEDILRAVDDETLFKYYFGDFEFGRTYCSPLREDKHPTCGFFINKDNRIVFNDFGNASHRGGIIWFVATKFGLTFYQALQKICEDFNIKKINGIISGDKKDFKLVKQEKKEKLIQILPKEWDKQGLDYWTTYTITKEELEKNNVYYINRVFVNGYELKYEGFERYGLLIKGLEDKEYIKIYTPLHEDKKKKWLSSCPLKIPFGFKNLSYESDTLIITKGIKELILLKRYFPSCLAVQAEQTYSLSEDMIEHINNNFNRVIVAFDNDEQGIKACSYFNKFGWGWLNTPNSYKKIGIKDFADLVKYRGVNVLEDYLKYKKLIK